MNSTHVNGKLRPMLLCLWAIVVLVVGCTKDKPTEPTQSSVGALNPVVLAGTQYYIERVGQLDTLFNVPGESPNIASGDTLLFAAGTTFDCTGKTYSKANITLYLLGETPGATPVLKRDGTAPPSDNGIFYFNDGTTIDKTVEIKDLKFEAATNDPTLVFLRTNKMLNVNFTNVEFDMDDQQVSLNAKNITLDNCTFSSLVTSCIFSTPTGEAFDHDVDSTTFVNSTTTGAVECCISRSTSAGGTLQFSNSTFSASSPDAEYLQIEPQSMSAVVVNLRLIDNEFNDNTLNINDNPSADNVTLNIHYDGNNSDVAVCVEDTYINGDDITLVWDIIEWTKEDSLFGYEDFTSLTDKDKCVVGDSAYVKFKVNPVGDYGDYNNPAYDVAKVVWGDDDCTTEVDAWLNSQGLYNAVFDVSGITDTDFWWYGKVTFCDKTVTSTCIKWSTRPCRGGIPSWFEDQPGK